MELLELIEGIPSVFDNTALDCALILVLLLIAHRYFSSATKNISNLSKMRRKANTLRKTLELKADEVSALRQALDEARLQTESHISPHHEELKERELLAQIAAKQARDLEHEELEKRLEQAAQKHPRPR